VTERHNTPWAKQWTLHTVEIPADIADEVAQELSESLDKEHDAEWYADFKNDTHHYIIFRNRVFKIERKSNKQYNEAYEYGKSIGTAEYQLLKYPGIGQKRLANFLNEANKNTYANASVEHAKSTHLNSEDYHFEQDDLIYHDTYFGSRDFFGSEVVYDVERPVWGANYYGYILDNEVGEKELYDFLREALMQEYDDVIPVRGPKEFAKGEWKYTFGVDGDLSNFIGTEKISYDRKVVYRMPIHGGFIG